MKKKKEKLDNTDIFINSGRMTKEDEQAISAYIQSQKGKQNPKLKRKRAA